MVATAAAQRASPLILLPSRDVPDQARAVQSAARLKALSACSRRRAWRSAPSQSVRDCRCLPPEPALLVALEGAPGRTRRRCRCRRRRPGRPRGHARRRGHRGEDGERSGGEGERLLGGAGGAQAFACSARTRPSCSRSALCSSRRSARSRWRSACTQSCSRLQRWARLRWARASRARHRPASCPRLRCRPRLGYIAGLALASISPVQACPAGGVAQLALLVRRAVLSRAAGARRRRLRGRRPRPARPLVATGDLLGRGLVRVHQPHRGRHSHALGEGAAHAGREARRAGGVPRVRRTARRQRAASRVCSVERTMGR